MSTGVVMDLPRVLVVIGTRPEGIKLAPVVDALRTRGEAGEVRVVLTGQHTELMDQVLSVFNLDVAWDLGIMREGQDLYDVAHGCLDGLRGVVREYRPQLLVVEGDTATVLFGGLVGFFERTAVAHVEAGLRSRDKWRPFPEEIFRRLTGVLADLHFAPTPEARANLLAEGVPGDGVFVTGNTVVDALQQAALHPRDPRDPELRDWCDSGDRLILVTAHRRESFGAPLREAFQGLREVADRFPDVRLVYPVHPNPNVREAAQAVLSGHPRIRLTEPLDYLDLVYALSHATLTITDSGGIQEEAPSFGTPVLVLRQVTERPEGVRAGVATLVGTERARIVAEASRLLERGVAAEARPNPYGDGRAGERIADVILHRLTGSPRTTTDWEGA